jgi:son of sevenless-like protein
MFTTRLVDPLTANDKLHSQNRGATFAAAFQYTEQSNPSALRRDFGLEDSEALDNGGADVSSLEQRKVPRPIGMNGYTATPDPPPALYVRALYNYDADDQTSLSFRQGDIIQVLTQLESGWWDGVINDVRGWFPSNYCAVVSGPDDPGELGSQTHDESDTSADSGADEDDYEEHEDDLDSDGNPRDEDSDLPIEGAGPRDQEEAAFWIPQATPDGRLFYFNTLTGVSTMELPLETPTSMNETGPHDRTNFFVPDQTRPPPEMMARGLENDEDDYDGSASEAEGESLMLSSHASLPERKGSAVSNSLSTAASMDSISSASPSRNNLKNIQHPAGSVMHSQSILRPNGVSSTSFAANPAAHMPNSTIPRYFVDDGTSAPVTWGVLVENMRQSIESYRKAINNHERAEFVRLAEDISDHLRMLLAAGSGTTDNHSGNPSIISMNKALYPHFRDMMSRFSKLVLSSHIAAADWPGPDALAKCLQEADGVLHGVYGYVEVARQQRGEELPRLVPGFVSGSKTGGNWRNNSLPGSQIGLNSTSFMDQEDSDTMASSAILDAGTLHNIDDRRKLLVLGIRRLEDQLHLSDKLFSPSKQLVLGDTICGAAGTVIDAFRPWINLIESVNLASQGSAFQNPQLLDFSSQKQKAYDSVAELVASCQAVTAPLADEWAESRGQPLEDRLNTVKAVSRGFDNIVSQISYSLQLLLDTTSAGGAGLLTKDHRMTDGGEVYQKAHLRVDALHDPSRRPQLGDIGQSHSYTPGVGPPPDKYRRPINTDKARQFFGQMPPPDVSQGSASAGAPPDGTPWFLQLDHQNEVAYETKNDPPQLKSGTLRGLVEQLTRHDRLDASFNGTFLLTYRSFTTAAELFELLVRRFSIQPPPGLSREDYPTWEERKQKLVRFRVVNILKNWFETYWMEENNEASQRLLERAYAFAKNTIASTKTPGSGPLMASIEQRMKGQDTSAKRLVLTLTNSAPAPILPKNMKKLKFLDIDATEFARQLTIIESKLYGKIKSTECLDKTWQRKVKGDGPDPAPNVKSLILHSNQLTNWVAEMILQQAEVKKRVIVIKHFVTIADVRASDTFPPIRLANRVPEMSSSKQLLNAHFDRVSVGHCTNSPTQPYLGPDEPQNC